MTRPPTSANIAAPVTIGGVDYFDANTINQALLASLNQISTLTFPADGGVNAGQAVGGIDLLAVTGDMANRYENNGGTYQNTVQIDANELAAVLRHGFPAAVGGGLTLTIQRPCLAGPAAVARQP